MASKKPPFPPKKGGKAPPKGKIPMKMPMKSGMPSMGYKKGGMVKKSGKC